MSQEWTDPRSDMKDGYYWIKDATGMYIEQLVNGGWVKRVRDVKYQVCLIEPPKEPRKESIEYNELCQLLELDPTNKTFTDYNGEIIKFPMKIQYYD